MDDDQQPTGGPPMLRIRMDRRGRGEVTDQHGRLIEAVTGVTINARARRVPEVTLDVLAHSMQTEVETGSVRWRGLDHVPIHALRYELGRRLPGTHQPLLADGRYADLLAISYELDLGDDADQDVAEAIRMVLIEAEVAAERRRCAHLGDQEHDHEMCRDVIEEDQR